MVLDAQLELLLVLPSSPKKESDANTCGWLKASHRAIDPARSKSWGPWHPLTQAAQKPVEPGKIEELSDRDPLDRQPVQGR
jgi:hypothetical protein